MLMTCGFFSAVACDSTWLSSFSGSPGWWVVPNRNLHNNAGDVRAVVVKREVGLDRPVKRAHPCWRDRRFEPCPCGCWWEWVSHSRLRVVRSRRTDSNDNSLSLVCSCFLFLFAGGRMTTSSMASLRFCPRLPARALRALIRTVLRAVLFFLVDFGLFSFFSLSFSLSSGALVSDVAPFSLFARLIAASRTASSSLSFSACSFCSCALVSLRFGLVLGPCGLLLLFLLLCGWERWP